MGGGRPTGIGADYYDWRSTPPRRGRIRFVGWGACDFEDSSPTGRPAIAGNAAIARAQATGQRRLRPGFIPDF